MAAISIAWLLTRTLLTDSSPQPLQGPVIFSGAVAFFFLGLIDDIYRLPEWLRFVFQVIISLAIAVMGPSLQTLQLPGLEPIQLGASVAIWMTVFWYVGFVNLFNFMDGTDGIAAGEAALAGLALAWLSQTAWPLIMSGAALGFLFFNYSPSKIFMGDSGSYLLGYLLSVSCILAATVENSSIPFVVCVMICGTFVVDTTATLFRRIANRERWYTAHRSHYYQRLSDLGFSHSQIFWINLLLTSCLILLSWIYLQSGPRMQAGTIALSLGIFALGIKQIHRFKARNSPIATEED